MLDTIVLTLSKGMYIITDPDRFTPSARWATDNAPLLGTSSFISSKQNPLKRELRAGNYKPRLTVTQRFNHARRYEATLKVELSLPKLMFNNNFDELMDTDFDNVAKLLQEKLKEMGVLVFWELLINAPVSAIHYSKNIPLTDGSTPYSYIKHIRQANITARLDTNQTDYRNEGHSFKLHANSYEISFYDKIKDLQIARSKGIKRAVDRDSDIQLSLFDQLEKRDFFEVLRMEVRLNRRQKMKPLFKQLGIESELTFQHLFSSQIAQKVLLHYLDYVEQQRPALLDFKPKSNKDLIAQLMIHNSQLKPRKILQLVGLKNIMDSMGMREVRSVFGNRLSQCTWYSLVRETKDVALPLQTSPFSKIRSHLQQFEPLKLVDFQERMLNNDKNETY